MHDSNPARWKADVAWMCGHSVLCTAIHVQFLSSCPSLEDRLSRLVLMELCVWTCSETRIRLDSMWTGEEEMGRERMVNERERERDNMGHGVDFGPLIQESCHDKTSVVSLACLLISLKKKNKKAASSSQRRRALAYTEYDKAWIIFSHSGIFSPWFPIPLEPNPNWKSSGKWKCNNRRWSRISGSKLPAGMLIAYTYGPNKQQTTRNTGASQAPEGETDYLLQSLCCNNWRKYIQLAHWRVDWKIYPGTRDCLNHGSNPGQVSNCHYYFSFIPFFFIRRYIVQEQPSIRECAWCCRCTECYISPSIPINSESCYTEDRDVLRAMEGRLEQRQSRSEIAVVAYTQPFYFFFFPFSMCSDFQVCQKANHSIYN